MLDEIVTIGIVGGVGYVAYVYYSTGGDLCKNSLIGMSPICMGKGVFDFFKNQYDTGDAGVPFVLDPCKEGWVNDGLTCRNPISCRSIGDCFSGKGCGCSGGEVVGRLNNQSCPADHPDKIGLLCYRQCPEGYVHTEGMPYLCRDTQGGNFWDVTGGKAIDNFKNNPLLKLFGI